MVEKEEEEEEVARARPGRFPRHKAQGTRHRHKRKRTCTILSKHNDNIGK